MITINFIKTLYGKVLIPASYYVRGDMRFRYYEFYKDNLRKSKSDIEEYQLGRLKKLLKHAYKTVPYYRELFDRTKLKPSDINSVDDLKKIPLLTKNIINANFDKLRSSKKYKLLEETSGGSTGNRVVICHDKRYKETSRAVVLRDLFSAGIEPGDKIAWIWGSPMENRFLKGSILHKLLWKVNRRIIFDTFEYTDQKLGNWLKTDFTNFKPDFIYGYALSIYEIARFIKERGIKIPKIKKIVCTAQKLEHRSFIESVFKCKVIDQYGCREVPSIAIEDDNYIMHSSDDYVIAEIDEEGRIILTPLESYGMPLIRYVVGDYGVKQQRTGKDKHPFNQFRISIGRICELLLNKKNQKVYPGKINLEMAKEKLNVGEFQLVQLSLSKAELNIVKGKQTNPQDVKKLKRIITDVLGCGFIKVNYLKKFPIEKSGKKIGYKCMIKQV